MPLIVGNLNSKPKNVADLIKSRLQGISNPINPIPEKEIYCSQKESPNNTKNERVSTNVRDREYNVSIDTSSNVNNNKPRKIKNSKKLVYETTITPTTVEKKSAKPRENKGTRALGTNKKPEGKPVKARPQREKQEAVGESEISSNVRHGNSQLKELGLSTLDIKAMAATQDGTAQLAREAKSYSKEALKVIRDVMNSPSTRAADKLSAAQMLLDRAYGKTSIGGVHDNTVIAPIIVVPSFAVSPSQANMAPVGNSPLANQPDASKAGESTMITIEQSYSEAIRNVDDDGTPIN